MKVSVILPVRNGASFLPRSVDSVLNQTRRPEEILIIDDGSTDETAAVAKQYGSSVVFLSQESQESQEPQGPAVARNRGFDRASGDVIAFLDADDWWERDKLRRQLEYLERHPNVGICHTATAFVDAAGQPLQRPNTAFKPRIQGRCLSELLQRNPITTSSVVLRTSVLGRHRCDATLARASDWDLWLQLAPATEFGYIDERLTGYQFHGANISLDDERMFRSSVEVMGRALERGLSPEDADLARRSRRRHLLTLGHLHYEAGRWPEARKAFQQEWAVRQDMGAALRYMATYLPMPVYARARTLWQAVWSRNRKA